MTAPAPPSTFQIFDPTSTALTGVRMPENTGTKPTLNSLPIEMFNKIANYLPVKDLKSLRLTCETLRENSNEMFSAKGCPTIMLIMAPNSLNGLLELSGTVFGPRMEKVIIGSQSLKGFPHVLQLIGKLAQTVDLQESSHTEAQWTRHQERTDEWWNSMYDNGDRRILLEVRANALNLESMELRGSLKATIRVVFKPYRPAV